MRPTIGIAVPCYANHYTYLRSLLQNIASSSDKPDQVVISCSSWFIDYVERVVVNGIPVTVMFTSYKLNAAQNRNRAARQLTTDLVSFVDADDCMHPRRIEFLRDIFATRPDISVVYHGYAWEPISNRRNPFWTEDAPAPLPLSIVKDPSAIGLMVDSTDSTYLLHHAHVTVRASVFAQFQFSENPRHARIEDSLYGATLAANNVPMLYLNNRLTRYTFFAR